MAIPAHLWITDETGSPIRGASKVTDREGSIEVLGFNHGVHALADAATGSLLGVRSHSPLVIEKEFDRVSPMLYRAVTRGLPLRKAELKWYSIDDSGCETEYFNMIMENVHVVSVAPKMHNIKENAMSNFNHCEVVQFRYGKISWRYCDGNIAFSDEWGR